MIDSLNPALFMSPQLEQASETMRSAAATGTSSPGETKGEVPNFESLLFSMLVKEMRQSMGSEMFAGDNGDILGSMFDMHLGDHMAQFARLGMNESILGTLGNAPQMTSAVKDTRPAETQAVDPTAVQPTGSEEPESV